MKNFAKLLGIIALAAVIVFTMAACGGGGGPKAKGLDGFSKDPPSAAVLTGVGINVAQYNAMVTAGGSGFQGWKKGSISLAWTGKSEKDFNTMKAELLKDTTGFTLDQDGEGFDGFFAEYTYGTSPKYNASLFLSKIAVSDFPYFPIPEAGVMVITLQD